MEKNRGMRTIAIIALIVSVIGLSVGFAAFAQTLNIGGVGKVKGNTWLIQFANLSTPTLGSGITGDATVDTTASITGGTSISFAVSLYFPSDEVYYDFEVQNNGTLDAEISSITLSGVDTALLQKVNYSLKYDNGDGTFTALAVGDTLDAGDAKDLRLVVQLDPGTLATELPSTDVSLSLGATIVYEQK